MAIALFCPAKAAGHADNSTASDSAAALKKRLAVRAADLARSTGVIVGNQRPGAACTCLQLRALWLIIGNRNGLRPGAGSAICLPLPAAGEKSRRIVRSRAGDGHLPRRNARPGWP